MLIYIYDKSGLDLHQIYKSDLHEDGLGKRSDCRSDVRWNTSARTMMDFRGAHVLLRAHFTWAPFVGNMAAADVEAAIIAVEAAIEEEEGLLMDGKGRGRLGGGSGVYISAPQL